MKKLILILAILFALSLTLDADARGRSRTSSSGSSVQRSSTARSQFMKQTGYPKGRSGYVVDHVVPLKRGGADKPSNMQWQTKEAAKEKDKWE